MHVSNFIYMITLIILICWWATPAEEPTVSVNGVTTVTDYETHLQNQPPAVTIQEEA